MLHSIENAWLLAKACSGLSVLYTRKRERDIHIWHCSGLRKGKGSPKALTQLDARVSSNTRFGHRIPHRNWRETKQYPWRIRPGHITQLFLISPPFPVGHSVARLSMFCEFFPTCSAIAKSNRSSQLCTHRHTPVVMSRYIAQIVRP